MLPFGLRARRDYLLFRFRRYWAFYLSTLGLSLGLLSLAAEFLPGLAPKLIVTGVTIVGFFGGVMTFGRGWRNHRVRAAEIVLLTQHAPGVPGRLLGSYEHGAVVEHPALGAAVVDDSIARALDEDDLRVQWLPDQFELADELRGTAVQVIRARLRRREISFNGPAVRLMADLSTPLPTEIPMQRATYFDGECSNELAHWQIRTRHGNSEADGFADRYVLDDRGRLRALAQSLLANLVGISTLAFTADNRLVLVVQSARSGASPELYAPSGSGSLEPRDLPAGGSPSFRDFIVAGMERELREECRLRSTVALDTSLIGAARWMGRGGRPELFGVTRIAGMTAGEFDARRVRRGERVFIHQIETCVIDLEALAGVDPLCPLDMLPGVPAEVTVSASMPLLLALRAFGLRLASDPGICGAGWRHH